MDEDKKQNELEQTSGGSSEASEVSNVKPKGLGDSKVEDEKTDSNKEEVTGPAKTEEERGSDEELVKEQLAVFKEVREELIKAYKTQQENKKVIETLTKEVEFLKTDATNYKTAAERMNKELVAYKTREEEAQHRAYFKRLEQLSTGFRLLGQTKTVEQLSSLPESVITELEKITSLALKKRNDEKLDSLTVPTQSMNNVVKPKVEKTKKPTNGFSFEGLCKTLNEQQKKEGNSSSRAINT